MHSFKQHSINFIKHPFHCCWSLSIELLDDKVIHNINVWFSKVSEQILLKHFSRNCERPGFYTIQNKHISYVTSCKLQTHILISPRVYTASSSKDPCICRPCVWLKKSITNTWSIVSSGWWSTTGVRGDVSEVAAVNSLKIGQRQGFLWSLRERMESIHTTVRKSTASNRDKNKEYVEYRRKFKKGLLWITYIKVSKGSIIICSQLLQAQQYSIKRDCGNSRARRA